MLLNIFVAATNAPGVLPIMRSYNSRDYLTCGCLIFAVGMSAISHLVENHKHGMPGIPGVNKSISMLTNQLDRAGVVLLTSRLLWLASRDVKIIINNPGVVYPEHFLLFLI